MYQMFPKQERWTKGQEKGIKGHVSDGTEKVEGGGNENTIKYIFIAKFLSGGGEKEAKRVETKAYMMEATPSSWNKHVSQN